MNYVSIDPMLFPVPVRRAVEDNIYAPTRLTARFDQAAPIDRVGYLRSAERIIDGKLSLLTFGHLLDALTLLYGPLLSLHWRVGGRATLVLLNRLVADGHPVTASEAYWHLRARVPTISDLFPLPARGQQEGR